MGYTLAALGVWWVRILLIGIPAALVAITVLAGAWREAGDEADTGAETPTAPEGATA